MATTVYKIRTALRGAARARDVVGVLTRYGWADVAAEWGLPRSLRPVVEDKPVEAGLPNLT